ncbi:phosphoglycerate mutase [Mucilaginibacter terrenus]|uniref:Phosphoglycerate mutase n=1 Tax=Mucilaginibacter terrenus TaxID=2482727 RepID=A0A3E2NPG3_9SPHI|nr:histidine phosphatase family protein [Mucilaginibacter terrenus]RFZ82780.1 phosphoglycerate mutase [Mucilaginibacter terrenus]
MTKILLVRHAVTNLTGTHLLGRTPGVPLSKQGMVQAESLAKKLSVAGASAVFSSPIQRVEETARPIAQALNLTCNILGDLQELDFGDWTNKTISELEGDEQFKLFNTFRSGTRIPGGELMLEAQTRIVSALERLRNEHVNDTIIVVSHSDIIKAALAFYLGMPIDMMQRIEISPASVSVLELYPETARVTLLNDISDL